jgi:hypothetical protein
MTLTFKTKHNMRISSDRFVSRNYRTQVRALSHQMATESQPTAFFACKILSACPLRLASNQINEHLFRVEDSMSN